MSRASMRPRSVYDKLDATLAYNMLSIDAVRGVATPRIPADASSEPVAGLDSQAGAENPDPDET